MIDPEDSGNGAIDVKYWMERDIVAGIDPYQRWNARSAALISPDIIDPGTWVMRWVENQRIAASTRRTWLSLTKHHIVPHWKSDQLSDNDVTRAAVQLWIDDLHTALTPRSIRTVLTIFRAAIEEAILDGQYPIEKSPFLRIRLDPPEPTGRDAITPKEVGFFLAHLTTCVGVGIVLAAGASRISEVTAKRKRSDWNPDRRAIEILLPPAVQRRSADRRTRNAKAKTAAGIRRIYFCDVGALEIEKSLASHNVDTIFISRQRKPVANTTVRRAFELASERSGMHVTPHILRHSAATWMAEDKIHPRAIDEQLGWAARGQGMQAIYVHPTPAMRREREAAMQDRMVDVMAAFQDQRAALAPDVSGAGGAPDG